jgi:hypothetical protein
MWFKFLGLILGYDALYLFKKDTTPKDDPIKDIAGVYFEEATQRDFDMIIRLNSDRPNNFIRTRTENREICYVARTSDANLLAYFWVAPGKRVFGYRSEKFSIKAHDVYIRDIKTLPEQRGRGITPKFLEWIDYELFNKGKKSMWAAINCLNYSSQRAFKKAGFYVDRELYFFCLPLIKKDVVFSRKKQRINLKTH